MLKKGWFGGPKWGFDGWDRKAIEGHREEVGFGGGFGHPQKFEVFFFLKSIN